MSDVTDINEYRARKQKRDRFAAVRDLLRSGRLIIPSGDAKLDALNRQHDHALDAMQYMLGGQRHP